MKGKNFGLQKQLKYVEDTAIVKELENANQYNEGGLWLKIIRFIVLHM